MVQFYDARFTHPAKRTPVPNAIGMRRTVTKNFARAKQFLLTQQQQIFRAAAAPRASASAKPISIGEEQKQNEKIFSGKLLKLLITQSAARGISRVTSSTKLRARQHALIFIHHGHTEKDIL